MVKPKRGRLKNVFVMIWKENMSHFVVNNMNFSNI